MHSTEPQRNKANRTPYAAELIRFFAKKDALAQLVPCRKFGHFAKHCPMKLSEGATSSSAKHPKPTDEVFVSTVGSLIVASRFRCNGVCGVKNRLFFKLSGISNTANSSDLGGKSRSYLRDGQEPMLWVKTKPEESTERFKARRVAKEYAQKAEINYEENSVHWCFDTVRMVPSVASTSFGAI
ncbi:hypothetical protein ILUMI_09368 [Ignelater luminosus]|uniref:Uncharacterized protein n=1 Tax=Ignelater luminosus TaxID=2038154 RepID=A0A8K0D2J7_IGNLU|nr:hypothetical protein ILUMI_09368 [Ignelater luminosus]